MRNLVLLMCLGAVISCGARHAGGAPDATPGACGSNADCPDAQFCSANLTCIDVGQCTADQDCTGGKTCGSDGTCDGSACGGTHLDLTYVAPNFMLALDRSCSMKQKLAGSDATKWEAAVAAESTVLEQYATTIRWGATLFPDTTGDSCGQDAIPFPIADGNAASIETTLNDALGSDNPLFPKGPCVTNIDTGIEQAATDPGLADPTRQSFVMLVTDGAQAGCSEGGSADGATAAIATLLTHGVKTFVVGFGSEVNATQLTAFAQAGGEALTGGSASYYQADDAAALDAAFATIANLVISCSYTVAPVPTDLSEMYVYFSGSELVPRDPTHVDGWDYDTTTAQLTLYGDDCTRLKTRVVTQVDVLFGCPTPPIP